MPYDFTTFTPRRGIGAEKWQALEHIQPGSPDLAPYSIADMEFQTAPEIIAALREAADFGVYGYTVADSAYRAAVCAWMKRRHHWTVEPDWIFQAFGVIPAISQAVLALTQPGEGVIIQPPVYPPFRHLVRGTGRALLENPLRIADGRYEMDLDGLAALAARPDTKLLVLCSPHNPVGRVWTRVELQAVADLCAEHGVTVFSDEIHADFVFPGHPHIPFATLEGPAAEGCIVGTSASKSFNLAGLTTANIIVSNPNLRSRLIKQALSYTGEFNSYFGLCATRAAYERAEGWLDELLTVIWGNYEYCKQSLHHIFPSVTVYPLEGTYLLWADFRSLGLEADELERLLNARQLYFSEGKSFGTGGSGFERINLACPRKCLAAAMEGLSGLASELNRHGR